MTCPIEEILFGGARGGGKTDALLGRSIIKSLRWPGKYRGLLMRRTYDELDEVVGRARELLEPAGARWRGQRHTLEFPWGGWLKLRFLQKDRDAERYQGHSYNDLLIDEVGNFPDPAPIDKLNGTLRDKHGVPVGMAMTANPGGPGHDWVRKRYIEPADPGAPFTDPETGAHRVYIPSLLSDNPLLMNADPRYVRRLLRTGPAWLVRAWLLGDWNAAPDGNVIKIQWFSRYIGEPGNVIGHVQSWDTGIKPREINDPSVCTTWAVTKHGAYLVDVFRERMTYPKLRQAAKDQFNLWKPMLVLVEDKSSGQALVQDLRNETTIPVKPIEPIGDKMSRMIAETGTIENGHVYLPETAPWLLTYEGELSVFPMGAHDDQVDSTSQSLKWWRTSMIGEEFQFESVGRRAGASLDITHDDGALDILRTGGDRYAGFNP